MASVNIQEALKLWKEGHTINCEIDGQIYIFNAEYSENLEIPIRMIERGKFFVENK